MVMTARNTTRNAVLATGVRVADTHWQRMRGLMLRAALAPGEALWIVPSRGVHTCWMRFPIDVVALDEAGRVVDLVPAMAPWRLRMPRPATAGVLELEAGSLASTGTQLGDRIVFEGQA
jgi:uncharacterized membrane protein (UPF0127 family)